MLFLLIYNFKTIHKWNLHCLLEFGKNTNNPAAIYLSKVNHANTRTICGICSKLSITTTANFAQISHIVLVFSLLTLGKQILVGNNNKEAKKSLQKNLGPNIMIATQKHERSWVIWAFSSHVMVNSFNIKDLLYKVSYCANASNEKNFLTYIWLYLIHLE